MLYLKPANFEDLNAEYEYVKEMPIDENGLTNEYFVSLVTSAILIPALQGEQ